MKIKVIKTTYNKMMAMAEASHEKHKKPIRPNILFRTLLKIVSLPDLLATHFSCKRIGMEKLGKREPAFFLMNHSSFIDLEIASSVLYPRPFNIVATTDGFIGKDWLMRQIGCIPTRKFVSDAALVRDMMYAIRKKSCSVIMFPEAGYSFDGSATTLPDTLGKCVKLMGVPLVMIRTYGAFSRDPLYNNLHRRHVNVSATMEYLLSKEEIYEMSAEAIDEIIKDRFTFDSFRWQQENHVAIPDKTRAEGLNRVLYKCPACLAEGKTHGEGELLTCKACGKSYRLTEYGKMEATEGETEIEQVTDWYAWERECARQEVESGEYSLDTPVEILAAFNTKNLYSIGTGRLVHTPEGFKLTSDDGELSYEQKTLASYSLNSDFNWYELGDIISIGDGKVLYYCITKAEGDVAAKARLAHEEAYKIIHASHAR